MVQGSTQRLYDGIGEHLQSYFRLIHERNTHQRKISEFVASPEFSDLEQAVLLAPVAEYKTDIAKQKADFLQYKYKIWLHDDLSSVCFLVCDPKTGSLGMPLEFTVEGKTYSTQKIPCDILGMPNIATLIANELNYVNGICSKKEYTEDKSSELQVKN